MSEEQLTISEIYAKGKENLQKMGVTLTFPLDSNIGASSKENRKYLDSLFFEPQFLDPVEANTSLFGHSSEPSERPVRHVLAETLTAAILIFQDTSLWPPGLTPAR
jgi:hypothetical protein